MSHTILFVDDDVLTQWIMSEVLSEAGFSVTSACRGSEASQLIEQSDEFDLLLTDFDLPDEVSGTDLSARWRELYPRRPVIYTSGRSLAVTGQLDANEAFVQKPFDAGGLLRMIDGLLGERWMQPAASGQGGLTATIH